MGFFSAFVVLDPQGAVALSERGLMFHAVGFMLIVAAAVYFLLFFFAYKYRAGNKKAKYLPNWEHGKLEELVWWVIPLEIVLVLGAMTWSSTHQLDPRRPLGDQAPLVVQVVALDWKWLFIYPEQDVATINYLALPVGKSVKFELTADAPMNSFWIPQLGGQIYAMTGMTTNLNLVADHEGSYEGSSANYSGEGFGQMKFNVIAMKQDTFDAWVLATKHDAAQSLLGFNLYKQLARPSVISIPPSYGAVEPGLFGRIVGQFMDPTMPGMQGDTIGTAGMHM
ncbi:MAG TPA: ubiquinol oxidase subunit II [Candidatus Paceibacterota bacterium]|jgi:cytochrome o ubiquinol oxidase subunit 2|nr:ubiquinol oxidase subunit II [Candidatus Paceibacterota bacterium]